MTALFESLANKASSPKEVEADPSIEDITYKLVQDVTNECEKLRQANMVDQACCKELYEAEQRLYRLQATFSKKVELERKQEQEPSLGFAFCPDEGIIITRYLRIRCMGNARTSCPIETELDVYAKNPRELIGKYPDMGKHGWHFYTRSFVEKDQLDANENQGQWKTRGKKDIVFSKGRGVGSKRALEYFEGGQRTKYKIIEYNLERNKYDVCVCKLYEEGSSCSCVEYNFKKKFIVATTSSGMGSLSDTASLQKKFKRADGAAASVEKVITQEEQTEMDVTENLSNRTASQKEAEAEPSLENITYEYLQNLTEECNELRRSAMFDKASLDKYNEVEPRLYRCQITFSKKMELERKRICDRREPSLGFVFCPAEGILLGHYLRNRCTGKATNYCPIETEVDVYAKDPQQLIGMYPHMGEHVWYFFSRSFAEKVQLEVNDNLGQWKTFGRKGFVFWKGKKVGSKQMLEYFDGGQKTKYKIIEYDLEPSKYDVCVCKLYEDGSLCSCVESTLKEEYIMATTGRRMKSLSNRVSLQRKVKKAGRGAASVETAITQEDNTEMDVTETLTNKVTSQKEAKKVIPQEDRGVMDVTETLTNKACSRKENITSESLQDLTNKCNELRQNSMFDQASLEEYHEVKERLYRLHKTSSKKTELKKWRKREEGYQSFGFIFRPTEGFLIDHYLRKANLDKLVEGSCPICEIEVNNYHPRDLTAMYPHTGKHVWYFFSHCLSDRVNQGANDQGHWRINGRKSAVYHEGKKVGNKLLLEYFEGDQKTKYKIIQYKLEPDVEEFCVYKLYKDETLCSCEKSMAYSLRRSRRKLCA